MRLTRSSFALLVTGFAVIPNIAGAAGRSVMVFKDPSCGCCEQWVSYMRSRGYLVTVRQEDDMAAVKRRLGVPVELASCHTAVVDGYVVEGHVPEEAVAKLLQSRRKIRGIALPGMPSGSPGMDGPKTGTLRVVRLDAPNQTFYTF